MRKAKVTKLSNNKNSYRTPLKDIDHIKGEPVVGESFFLLSSTHESGGIYTSHVKEVVEKDYGFDLHTENSIYKVELQEEQT